MEKVQNRVLCRTVNRKYTHTHKLAPVFNCCPAIHVHELDETDDFLIIAHRGLWEYISFQTAVDFGRAGENATL
jgi:adenylate cyclase